MRRRAFLGMGAGLTALASPAPLIAAASTDCPPADLTKSSKLQGTQNISDPIVNNDIYIPGYWPGSAYFDGMRALDHPHLSRAVPKKYNGSVRLLTRLGLNGDVAQALFPVHGHDVQISPDGKIGYYGSLEEQSYVCFDPKTLDLIALGKPYRRNWIGGGHGAFINDGALLALSERAPKVGYRGKPSRHFGRISLREPETLKVLESYSTHGVSPHDIRLLADGKHLAIANYGSTYPRKKKEYGVPRHIVEPSITVININDGRLVAKYTSGSRDMELRHLCAHDLDTIFAIQTELGLKDQDQPFHKGAVAAYETEFTSPRSVSYLPAPTIRTIAGTKKIQALGSEKFQKLMRHGLSIQYEPVHEEVIATYPATHSIIVFDARSGDLKQHIDCAKIGLDYPCGLIMLKDPRYYAVTGYWKNLYIFERGTHQLQQELSHYTTFFGHSHIAVT